MKAPPEVATNLIDMTPTAKRLDGCSGCAGHGRCIDRCGGLGLWRWWDQRAGEVPAVILPRNEEVISSLIARGPAGGPFFVALH